KRWSLYKLTKWADDHVLKRVVVTNAHRPDAELVISTLGLIDFFHLVNIGGECEHPKPTPDPYLKALEVLNVSKEHAFICQIGASAHVAPVDVVDSASIKIRLHKVAIPYFSHHQYLLHLGLGSPPSKAHEYKSDSEFLKDTSEAIDANWGDTFEVKDGCFILAGRLDSRLSFYLFFRCSAWASRSGILIEPGRNKNKQLLSPKPTSKIANSPLYDKDGHHEARMSVSLKKKKKLKQADGKMGRALSGKRKCHTAGNGG
ncbi:haloacid dehalogenase-like hydrolase domain-containing protein Sgpp isoform X2, partial [Tanacetum coccineum]